MSTLRAHAFGFSRSAAFSCEKMTEPRVDEELGLLGRREPLGIEYLVP